MNRSDCVATQSDLFMSLTQIHTKETISNATMKENILRAFAVIALYILDIDI